MSCVFIHVVHDVVDDYQTVIVRLLNVTKVCIVVELYQAYTIFLDAISPDDSSPPMKVEESMI